MATTTTLTDGRQNYTFEVYTFGTTFKPIAGLYAFASFSSATPSPKYIGETSDFNARVGNGLNTHHKIECAKRSGATHVLVMPYPGGEQARRDAEARLVAYYKPTCND